jgi:predicted ATP-grasp superfamily ATP-dependent carboligase
MVIISVVDGKICINGQTFGVHQLRESKEYLQSIGAEEAVFAPEDDDELNELHRIVERMEKASPEASGEGIASYYLN